MQSTVRHTLLKIKEMNISHPMTLYIFVVGAEHDRVDKLKQMIDSKNLLENYTIHRQCDRFYLQ